MLWIAAPSSNQPPSHPMQIPRFPSLALLVFALVTAAFLTLWFVNENTPASGNLPRLQVGWTETSSSLRSGNSSRMSLPNFRFVRETRLPVEKTETSSGLIGDSSVAPEYATSNSGRLLLLSGNPHPICQKIITHLERRLKDSTHIRTVEGMKEPFTITNRHGAPDLFLRVDLVGAMSGGMLTSTFKSVVSATLGSEPWSDTAYTDDGSGAARITIDWRSTVDSESTFTGLSSDHYDAPARHIANHLAESITGKLAKLSEEHPPGPSLPAEFFGPYEPVADFDWLSTVSARRAASFCGLFTHNETYWTFQTSTNPVPTIEGLVQSLKQAGWTIHLTDLDGTAFPRLEARQGESRLRVFRSGPQPFWLPKRPPDQKHLEFVVYHRKSLTRAERTRALDLLLDRTPWDPEALAPFVRSFEADQRRRFFDRLMQPGPSSPRACLRLADHFLDVGQTNDARHHLLKAHALSATRPASESLSRQIMDLAGKIQPEARRELEYTPEICRELGFVEIEKVAQPMEFTRSFGDPLVFFGPFNHTLRITALTLTHPRDGTYPVEHRHAEKGMQGIVNEGFSSAGTSHSEHTLGGGLRAVTVRSEALPDARGVKFTVQPKHGAPSAP